MERAALEVAGMKEQMQRMHQDYQKSLDRTLRDEIITLKKDGKRKGVEILEEIYKNLGEFRLLKRNFPQLYETFFEDENIGRVIKRMDWLADFEELDKERAEKKLKEVKEQKKQVKEGIQFLKELTGQVEKRKIVATWHVFDDKIADGMDKEEALLKAEQVKKEVDHHGWLIVLNQPFIMDKMHKVLERYKKSAIAEEETIKGMESSKGRGTYAEHRAKQEYEKARKERRKLERICAHLLMANPKFLNTFKKQKMFWRERKIGSLMQKLLERVTINEINEKEWMKEVKKRVE